MVNLPKEELKRILDIAGEIVDLNAKQSKSKTTNEIAMKASEIMSITFDFGA